MSRYKTAYELTIAAMVMLSDSAGDFWSPDKVERWLMDSLRDYASHFSRDLTAETNCIAGQKDYALPDMYKTILMVEYPAGLTPPKYLTRLSHQNPRFANSGAYYDIVESQADAPATLMLSATPADGEQIVISYTADHYAEVITNIHALSRTDPCQLTWPDHSRLTGEILDLAGITQDEWADINGQYTVTVINENILKLNGLDTSAFAADYDPTDPGKAYAQLSVPPPHYEIILTFIEHSSQRERLMKTNQSPESSTLLLAQLATNCDKVWRRYERLLNEAKKRVSSSGLTHTPWTMPGCDRIY